MPQQTYKVSVSRLDHLFIALCSTFLFIALLTWIQRLWVRTRNRNLDKSEGSRNRAPGTRSQSGTRNQADHDGPTRHTVHGKQRWDDDQGGAASDLSRNKYTVGWVCALSVEMAAARAVLDEAHEEADLNQSQGDINTYVLGRIARHHVVVACLPADQYGSNNAAQVGAHMRRTFPSIYVWLLVGVGGGIPGELDLRLGDVVVSTRMFQYDLGKTVKSGQFRQTGASHTPDQAVLTAISALRAKHEQYRSQIRHFLAQMLERYPRMRSEYTYPGDHLDRLFDSAYQHEHGSDANCNSCDASKVLERDQRPDADPRIHYGPIGSANRVMRDGVTRDVLGRKFGTKCLEMEAAGLMPGSSCLVIRGVCDYADSHKNERWQRYAAATAACYAKEFLLVMPLKEQGAPRERAQSSAAPSRARVRGIKAGNYASQMFVSEQNGFDVADVITGDYGVQYFGTPHMDMMSAAIEGRDRTTTEKGPVHEQPVNSRRGERADR